MTALPRVLMMELASPRSRCSPPFPVVAYPDRVLGWCGFPRSPEGARPPRRGSVVTLPALLTEALHARLAMRPGLASSCTLAGVCGRRPFGRVPNPGTQGLNRSRLGDDPSLPPSPFAVPSSPFHLACGERARLGGSTARALRCRWARGAPRGRSIPPTMVGAVRLMAVLAASSSACCAAAAARSPLPHCPPGPHIRLQAQI